MSRFYYSRFVFIALLLFLNNIANAVNSEYKNSLEGIEFSKTSESSYSINLYTQKGYSEPVKVIKKNDLNYYILLPETKNAAAPLKIETSEIQEVNTKIYPYAGVDVNNGYTKINISTTKPVDFNLNIKPKLNPKINLNTGNSLSNVKPQIVASKKQEPVIKENINTNKTEVSKKTQNLKQKTTLSNNKLVENKPKKSVEQLQNKKSSKNTANKVKTVSKPAVTNKVITKNPTKTVAAKTTTTTRATKPVNRKVASAGLNRSDKELIVKKKTEEIIKPEVQDTYIKEDEYETKTEINEEIEDAKNSENKEDFSGKLDKKLNKKLIAQSENIDTVDGLDEFAYAAKLPVEEGFVDILKNKLSYIQARLTEYNLSIFDILLMVLTTIIGFFIMLFILSNRQNKTNKRKADIFGDNSKSTLVPKKNLNTNSKDEGKYFVFDKNVKQTGLLKPATSGDKKNYELSTYDPDIRIGYNHSSAKNNAESQSEYDIIQKILKEDVYVDIEPAQAETITKEKIETRVVKEEIPEENIQKSNIVTSPIAQEKEIQKKEEEFIKQEETQSELVVLSKNEIAPERGFMCVSYENNVSLIGYIFDDIFVLHNFKKPELESYEIQSRLSERDISSSLYIVKVAEDKMIIRVSNKAMKLELTL